MNPNTVRCLVHDVDYSHGVIYGERVFVVVGDGGDLEDRSIEATWSGIKDIHPGMVCELTFSQKTNCFVLNTAN